MTRMTGPDFAVMCNLINIYTHTHTHTHTHTTVATEANKSQIEDAVGSSWAALAAEEDP